MVTFNPPLDERKRQAIDRLGAGLVEKVRQTQQTKIKMQCILWYSYRWHWSFLVHSGGLKLVKLTSLVVFPTLEKLGGCLECFMIFHRKKTSPKRQPLLRLLHCLICVRWALPCHPVPRGKRQLLLQPLIQHRPPAAPPAPPLAWLLQQHQTKPHLLYCIPWVPSQQNWQVKMGSLLFTFWLPPCLERLWMNTKSSLTLR